MHRNALFSPRPQVQIRLFEESEVQTTVDLYCINYLRCKYEGWEWPCCERVDLANEILKLTGKYTTLDKFIKFSQRNGISYERIKVIHRDFLDNLACVNYRESI